MPRVFGVQSPLPPQMPLCKTTEIIWTATKVKFTLLLIIIRHFPSIMWTRTAAKLLVRPRCMSTFGVTVETIATIKPHPNADRLDIATLARFPDWRFVVQRDGYKPGEKVVYFPIDSVLPTEIIKKMGIELKENRVKTVLIRTAISQGIVGKPEQVLSEQRLKEELKEGDDVTSLLGVTKYITPCPGERPLPHLSF